MKNHVVKNIVLSSFIGTLLVGSFFVFAPAVTKAAEPTVSTTSDTSTVTKAKRRIKTKTASSTALTTRREKDTTASTTPVADRRDTNKVASSTREAARRDKGSATTTTPVTVNTACMVEAVTDREESLLSAWSKLDDSITTGLTNRSTALVEAWSKTTVKAQTEANKLAWKAWKENKTSAYSTFRTDRKAAWEAFKTEAKTACKVTTPSDEALERMSDDMIAI